MPGKTVWVLHRDGTPYSKEGHLVLFKSYRAARERQGMLDTVEPYDSRARLQELATRHKLKLPGGK